MPTTDSRDSTWNLAQLFVWVLTRDEGLVAKYSTLPAKAASLSGGLFSALSHADFAADFSRANWLIRQALVAGRLTAHTRTGSRGKWKKIPTEEWKDMDLALNASDGWVHPAGGHSKQGGGWGDLRFAIRQAAGLWPERKQGPDHASLINQEFGNVLSPGRLLRRHSDVQAASRMARWRRACGAVEPLSLNELHPDGLPDDPDTSATEALSWMVLGTAVSAAICQVMNTAEEHLSLFGVARYRLDLAIRQYSDAHRTVLLQALEADCRLDGAFWTSDAALRCQAALKYSIDEREHCVAARDSYLHVAAAEACVYGEIARVSSLTDRNAGLTWFLSRVRDAQRLLFKLIREEAIVMRGRRSATATEWEAIPTDHFRHPVQINLDDNALEASGEGSMEAFQIAYDGLPKWTDLQFSTKQLRECSGRLLRLPEFGDSGVGQTGLRNKSTIRDIRECTAWLVQLMRHNQFRTHSKAHFRLEAKSRFGIGPRGFERAWCAAILESGNENWVTPGRPKSNHRIET
jgi:hypothetical protein